MNTQLFVEFPNDALQRPCCNHHRTTLRYVSCLRISRGDFLFKCNYLKHMIPNHSANIFFNIVHLIIIQTQASCPKSVEGGLAIELIPRFDIYIYIYIHLSLSIYIYIYINIRDSCEGLRPKCLHS